MRRTLMLAAILSGGSCALAIGETNHPCTSVTLEITCPTTGLGVRTTLANTSDGYGVFGTRPFVQKAWKGRNALRLTVPIFAAASKRTGIGSQFGDIELEYVRAAPSNGSARHAVGPDIVMPTGAASVTNAHLLVQPFYATYNVRGSTWVRISVSANLDALQAN